MSEVKKVPEIRFAGFAEPWEQRKLTEFVQFYSGLTYAPSDVRESGTLVLRSSNVNNGEIVNADNVYVRPEIVNSENVKKGDIIVVVRNGSRSLIGKHARIKHFMPDTVIGAFMTGIRSECPEFTNALLDTAHFDEEVSKNMGATINQITGYMFSKMEFIVPYLEEQKKIGQYFEGLDHLITLHQSKHEKLVTLKQAMLEKMFPQNGSNVPEVRFTGFTGSWEQRKLGDLTNILSASRVHKDEWRTSGVPFFRSSDVMAAFNGTQNEKAFIDPSLFEKLSAISGKPEKGDLFITGGGSVGIPYIVPNDEPLYSKDADLIWIKHNPNTDPDFLYTYFVSPFFRKYLMSISHVGTIAHYTIEQVKATPIYLPEIDEQMKIGTLFRNLDTLITLQQRKCESLKHIKAALLQKMFV